MRVPQGIPVVLFVAAALAGCVQGEDDPPSTGEAIPADPHAGHDEHDPWSIALTECHEAGGVAAYSHSSPIGIGSSHVPDPWVLADVRDELGDPHVSSLGYPMLGAVTGHWHQAIVCKQLQLGYVAVSVEAPPFDWGGAERHMLFSGLSIGDDTVRTAILAASGFEPTHTQHAEVLAPAGDAVYAILDDETKGVYEGWGPVHELQTKPSHTVRFWTTVTDGDGDDERPIAFDMTFPGTVRHASTGDSTGALCHSRTEMHGPQGGQCQLGLVISYQAEAMTLRYAGAADTTVEHAWHH